jgi:hypothetical protein
MADSQDLGSMTELPAPEFDRSWLWRETSLEGYFGRDERQAFIDADDGTLADVVAEFRTQLAAERAAVAAVWRDGDELWEWRNEKWAPQFEATDSVGEMGLAVIRAGCVIAAWTTGTWA